jgi:thioesterase domain-containing protein
METRERVEPALPIHFQLIQVWQQVLGCPVSGINEDFFELGGHSLLIARLLDEIEKETGRLIPISAFLNDPTIAGCTAAMLNVSQEEPEVIQLQQGNGATPLFYFHGDILGGGFYVRRLVPNFHPARPIYVLAPPRLPEGDPLPSMEEIAARYADSIQQERPHGPYIMAGFCIGGITAYEVARQLTLRGETVESAIMIDPEIGSRTEALCLKAVDWLGDRKQMEPSEKVERFIEVSRKLAVLRHVKESSFSEKSRFLMNGLRKLRRRGRNGVPATTSTVDATTLTRGRTLDAFQWMSTAYRPRPYGGEVGLLYTDEQLEATPHLIEDWRKAAPQLKARRIPGGHLTAITTYASSVVTAIRAELRTLYMMGAAFCEMIVIV